MAGGKRVALGVVLFITYVGVEVSVPRPINLIAGGILFFVSIGFMAWGVVEYRREVRLIARHRVYGAMPPPPQPPPPPPPPRASPPPPQGKSSQRPSGSTSQQSTRTNPNSSSTGPNSNWASHHKEPPQAIHDAAVLLGVKVSDSAEEIDRAYKGWVKTLHPDRNPSPYATDQLKRVNIARDTLLEYLKRR